MNFEDLVSLYLTEDTNEYHAALNKYSDEQDEDACEIHIEVIEAAKELDYAF